MLTTWRLSLGAKVSLSKTSVKATWSRWRWKMGVQPVWYCQLDWLLHTSYKPKMWHGSSVEVLHTSVTQDPAGTPVIFGGVSLFLEVLGDGGFSWSPLNWVLNGVHGSSEESEDSIQVEMISRDVSKMVEVKHILTLKEDTLISQINISNLKNSQLKMRGSILTHLTVSTPEATYALGLEGSSFFDREPLNLNFCIVPPDIRKSTTSSSRQMWPFKEFFSADKKEIQVTDDMDIQICTSKLHYNGQG